ncbi:hypothetical protein JOM56_004351 [Amanita muscaria]
MAVVEIDNVISHQMSYLALLCRRFVDELISPRGGGELKHEAQAREEEAVAVQQEQQNDSGFAEAETASGNLKKEEDHLNQTKDQLDDVTPLPEETRRLLEQRPKMMYQIFYTNRVLAMIAPGPAPPRGTFDSTGFQVGCKRIEHFVLYESRHAVLNSIVGYSAYRGIWSWNVQIFSTNNSVDIDLKSYGFMPLMTFILQS